uniref:Thiamine phosphate synthase/TenI domain-containing protein n=1 Tax=Desulfobacca acetoxidans TaxID=60893 RepID=A0A7V6A4T9_9BACT
MAQWGYDPSQPIIVWDEGQVVIDGHTRIKAAQEAGASYVNIGPIFPTQTKPEAQYLGPEALENIVPHLRIPWTTIGGITAANIVQVVSCGARHPAVMTAVTAASEVTPAAEELRRLILAYRA